MYQKQEIIWRLEALRNTARSLCNDASEQQLCRLEDWANEIGEDIEGNVLGIFRIINEECK